MNQVTDLLSRTGGGADGEHTREHTLADDALLDRLSSSAERRTLPAVLDSTRWLERKGGDFVATSLVE